MHETEFPHFDMPLKGELADEASRWGAADWCTGGRISQCPYPENDWLAHHWKNGFISRERIATRMERAFAAAARILRTQIIKPKQ